MVVRKLKNDSVQMNNGRIRIVFTFERGVFDRQVISVKTDRRWRSVADTGALLLIRQGGYGGLIEAKCQHAEIVRNTRDVGIVRLHGESGPWTYKINFSLAAGSQCIEGVATAKTRVSQVGWVAYPLTVPTKADCWTYPWVMADRLRLPTNIGRNIGIHRPNHIWAKLCGVPAMLWREGGHFGLIGFPLSYNYENGSLAYNTEIRGGKRLSIGQGLVKGVEIEDANKEYVAHREYSFPFQIFGGLESFEDCVREWQDVNRFSFDTQPKYEVDEVTRVIADGRRHPTYIGQRRYVSREKHGKRAVSGYQSGSDDNRIIVDIIPKQACVDYMLYLKTGDPLWRDRVWESMAFLETCQDAEGWFWENWDLDRNTFYFQGIDEYGPRTGRHAHLAEYVARLTDLLNKNNEKAPASWGPMVERCLDWICGQFREDGSIPMTVVPGRFEKASVAGTSAGFTSDVPGYADPDRAERDKASPMTRLLVAFLELEHLCGDSRLRQFRTAHERWVIRNAYRPQKWWGHWNDTGHTATVYSALKFVEYCVRAYELLGKERYLEMAAETASWSFFQHVPKQLEWCRQYTRGAMIEQDNYMQYGNDMGDNLIFQALMRLGKYTGKVLYREMALQSIATAQMTLNDDPRHPWYGSWNTYVADSTGLTVPFDTDPVTGVATHYSICVGLWDLWHLPEESAALSASKPLLNMVS